MNTDQHANKEQKRMSLMKNRMITAREKEVFDDFTGKESKRMLVEHPHDLGQCHTLESEGAFYTLFEPSDEEVIAMFNGATLCISTLGDLPPLRVIVTLPAGDDEL